MIKYFIILSVFILIIGIYYLTKKMPSIYSLYIKFFLLILLAILVFLFLSINNVIQKKSICLRHLMVKKLFLLFLKKIRNFESVCKKINIPIYEIKQIEKAIQVKNGKVFIVGGAVRDLIMKTKNENKVDLSVNINLNNLKYCLKRSKIRFCSWY